jgi:hypothetical protein
MEGVSKILKLQESVIHIKTEVKDHLKLCPEMSGFLSYLQDYIHKYE